MNSDLKSQLRELHITGAKEVDVTGKKAIVIFVPVPQLKAFQKLQTRVVRELEKKFSGKHVVFIAKRTILAKPTRKMKTKNKQKRPRRWALSYVINQLKRPFFTAELWLLFTTRSSKTWYIRQRSSAKGFGSDWTVRDSLKSIWIRALKPLLSTKPKLLLPFTRGWPAKKWRLNSRNHSFNLMKAISKRIKMS